MAQPREGTGCIRSGYAREVVSQRVEVTGSGPVTLEWSFTLSRRPRWPGLDPRVFFEIRRDGAAHELRPPRPRLLGAFGVRFALAADRVGATRTYVLRGRTSPPLRNRPVVAQVIDIPPRSSESRALGVRIRSVGVRTDAAGRFSVVLRRVPRGATFSARAPAPGPGRRADDACAIGS